jgi:hypothetical protein
MFRALDLDNSRGLDEADFILATRHFGEEAAAFFRRMHDLLHDRNGDGMIDEEEVGHKAINRIIAPSTVCYL